MSCRWLIFPGSFMEQRHTLVDGARMFGGGCCSETFRGVFGRKGIRAIHRPSSAATSKNQNRRLTRWSLLLQDFRFHVTYRPGPLNTNADGISRQCWTVAEEKEQAGGSTTLSKTGSCHRGGRCGDPPQRVSTESSPSLRN